MADAPGLAIVNLSQRLSAADAQRMVDAVAAQIVEDFAPAWGVVPCTPKLYAKVEDVPAMVAIILLVPKSDVDGAAGYHTEDTNGRISGVVAVDALLDAGWTLFDGANSISCCLSHECCEASKDPFVNVWVQMPGGDFDAFEMCDRVQGNSYVKDSVSLSNFLTPHAFDGSPPAEAKFDFIGVLGAPFDVAPNGYASRLKAAGTPYQVGMRPAEKAHPLSRTAQRQAT